MSAPSWAEIERLAAPQQRFDSLRSEAVAKAGAKLADLAYANAYDGAPEEVRAVLREAIEPGRPLDLQYTPYGGATVARRLVARALPPVDGARFEWRHVVLTPGAMAALTVCFRALVTGGDDEAVVVTPCWLDTPLYLANLDIRPVFVPVRADTLRLDLDALAAALSPRTRAVVLSQPANPSGLIYRADELRALAALLEGADEPPLLISDECHRDVRFDPDDGFRSPLEFARRACAVYSFGKHLFLQGQRLGYVAVSPRHPRAEAFAERLALLCRVCGLATPTALMQAAVAGLLPLRPDLSHVVARRARALETLVEAGYDVVPSQATFFLYPRTPDPDDFAFTERLARRGVLVSPAAIFHHRGHVRLSLTATDAMLDRALDALRDEARA